MNRLMSLAGIGAATIALAGCEAHEPVHDRPSTPDDSREYLTVEQQRRVRNASVALWVGVNPKQDWSEMVSKVFVACGGRLSTDEAFAIIGEHPRTTYDWAWRGPVERALLEKASWGWNPAPGPRCKLIRDALEMNAFPSRRDQ